MKKFGSWVLDHLKLVFTILTFTITLVVIGVVMLTSYTSYKKYEANFNQNDLDIRSLSPAQPTNTEISDSFKSQYSKKYSFGAEDLTVSKEDAIVEDYIDLTTSGGTISASLSLEKKAFVDIVFTVSSSYKTTNEDGEDKYGVEDLLSNVGFVVNGELMDDVVDLPHSEDEGPEWHKLVMSGFAIPAGQISVTISSNSGKQAMMPQVQNITFYASQPLSLPEAE